MERPGEKLKQARERLKLTYREVGEASQLIAERRGSDEFVIALSRLADIENKGTIPTIYRLYSLCAIYRLDMRDVLRWYGVPLNLLAADACGIGLAETHAVELPSDEVSIAPSALDQEIDLNQTTVLRHVVRRIGKLPLSLLSNTDSRNFRYGFIGMEDWSMYPVLHPGSLVLIDQSKRKIAQEEWANEFERPIYFIEHRDGFLCGWCSISGATLCVQWHPSSSKKPVILDVAEMDVVGQLTGVAMRLEPQKRPRARTSAVPTVSPGQ